MPSFDADRPENVAVVCPVCRARIDARVRDQPGTVECPDCFTPVDVPALEAVVSARPRTAEQPEMETYSIAMEPERPRRNAPPEPAVLELSCPSCGTPVDTEPGNRPRKTTCPNCLEVIPVPSRNEARSQLQRWRKRRPPDLDDEDDIPPEDLSFVPPAPDLLAAQGDIRREPPPPVPTWTFFTRVYSLPWHREVLARWAYTSLGWSVLGLAVASVHWLLLNDFIIAIPFFVLPIVLLVLWTGSYAVSTGMTVVEDTAAGADVIAHWNDGGWGDWLADSYGPVFLAAVTWTASFAAAKIAALTAGPEWYRPVFGAIIFLAYPVMLLSALQAGSMWTPLTGPVLMTFVRKPWAWAVYYGLAALIAAAYAAPVLFGLSRGLWFTTLILTGPLFSTGMLITARLLGRLGWSTLVAEGKPGKDPETLRSTRRRRDGSGKRNNPPFL